MIISMRPSRVEGAPPAVGALARDDHRSLPQLRAESRHHDPTRLERRGLCAHRISGGRRQRARVRTFPSKGFEIQVNNSHTDRIRSGSLYHVMDILDNSPAKDDEWFTEDITVKDDTITVKVNDKHVVNWTQPSDWNGGREGPGRRITGPGTIALQAHDPKSTVYYKNIRIKPLD